MPDEELNRRLDELKRGFGTERGEPFNHFYCPILHVDEPTTLCRGHIFPEKLGGKIWVPQREDVDNFFGSVVEADFVAVVKYRESDLLDIWLDPISQRQHRPKLELDGKTVGYYFPEVVGQIPAAHTTATLLGADGESICRVALKASLDELGEIDGKTIDLVVDRDYRSAVVASAIKAAHLTLFRMLGYSYVFSPTGILYAHTLRQFFIEHRGTPKKDLGTAIDRQFGKLQGMVAPIAVNDSVLKGTEIDGRVIFCLDAMDRPFAMGTIVRAGPKMLCVFGPGIGQTIDTYFSFLNERPKSLAVRIAQFNRGTASEGTHWGTSKTFRIEMSSSSYSDATVDS